MVGVDPLPAPVIPELAAAAADHRGAVGPDEEDAPTAGTVAGWLGRKSAKTALAAEDALPALGWPSISAYQ